MGGKAEQIRAPELRALNRSAISMRRFRKIVVYESRIKTENASMNPVACFEISSFVIFGLSVASINIFRLISASPYSA